MPLTVAKPPMMPFVRAWPAVTTICGLSPPLTMLVAFTPSCPAPRVPPELVKLSVPWVLVGARLLRVSVEPEVPTTEEPNSVSLMTFAPAP